MMWKTRCSMNFFTWKSKTKISDIFWCIWRKSFFFILFHDQSVAFYKTYSGVIFKVWCKSFNWIKCVIFNTGEIETKWCRKLRWFLTLKSYCNLYLQIIITNTMEIYNSAISKFLPTPSRSHYVFNLRDFARVVQVSPPKTYLLTSFSK